MGMRKGTSVFVLLLVTFSVFGWGDTGHRVTGCVAEQYLSKKARKALERILGGQSLAMASTWMDDVRSDPAYKRMADWHWVTIPYGQTYEASSKNPHGDIIETLERVIAGLKSKQLSPRQEAEYVKILIHLIGDIHQPLHVGARDDRGGNQVRVKWFGKSSNLHRVWDSDIIDGTKLSYTEFAESLDKPDAEQIRKWQHTSVREWAVESQQYHERVYAYDNGKLGYPYAYKNLPLIREQLLKAGIRIAGVLNEIYK